MADQQQAILGLLVELRTKVNNLESQLRQMEQILRNVNGNVEQVGVWVRDIRTRVK